MNDCKKTSILRLIIMHINTSFMKILPVFIFIVFTVTRIQGQAAVRQPAEYFGFKPGTDRQLIDYGSLISYLQELDSQSDRLKMVDIGESPLGRRMYIGFISAPENLSALDHLKEINQRLAKKSDLAKEQLQQDVTNGRVFVLATLSMHSGEVGPSQSAPLMAYDLVTTKAAKKLKWLRNTVFMMVPCHNPDGMDMVVNHYNKYKGTRNEGASLPGVYHKYIGHDNNRDFVTLTQKDTRAIARIYNKDWFPQVMVEKHQMGKTGPRYFVPPMHDPIAEVIDARIWNWTWIFGSNMVKDMTQQGMQGISQHYLFDDYWPGSTETCVWKNVIGMLTECASVKYATPVHVEPNELKVYGKGLAEYEKSINMVEPWPGGWWRLGDIVNYEIASMYSILETASQNREELLRLRHHLTQSSVNKGQREAPFYFIIPADQHDQSEWLKLIDLLLEHGIELYQLKQNIELNNQLFKQGDVVIPLAQPFRSFILEVMGRQHFPVRHYTPGGEMIKPYDITSWSLNLHRGITMTKINQRHKRLEQVLDPLKESLRIHDEEQFEPFWAVVWDVRHNSSFKMAFHALQNNLKVERLSEIVNYEDKKIKNGSFIVYNKESSGEKIRELVQKCLVPPLYLKKKIDVDTTPLGSVKVGLVESYFHDMDAGWTRFIFDTYGIEYTVLRPAALKEDNLSSQYNVLVFPDERASVLMEGKRKSKDDYYVSSYPPAYTEGMGKEGLMNVIQFVNGGGKVVSWGSSTNLFDGTLNMAKKENQKPGTEFQLPFNNIAEEIGKDGLYCPGTLLKMKVDNEHPLALGMREEAAIFYRGSGVYETSIPYFDMDRRVIGLFPKKDILLSGFGQNLDKLANKAALLWLKKGKGQLVLMGFNPQFRASMPDTYKLLFNALLLEDLN
ncbi:MAG: hypothetical protein GF313_08250 [Caldithrix sp.]|nr:hypothetical protein [Caldithrix sp.]